MTLDPGAYWTAVGVVYGAASLVAFVTFGVDKRAARRGQRRVPERVLHGLELIGGWPGALIGMAVWKHKRRKLSYVAVTALIAVAHLALWAWVGGVFD